MPVQPATNIFEKHNHRRCLKGGMDEARALCQTQGLRLTPVRARVLEILLESHKALGAYDILAILDMDGMGRQPPVVYRALEFLVQSGLVHRLEKLNAFAACCHQGSAEGRGHEPMFLICTQCRQVAETSLKEVEGSIEKCAAALGFEVQSRVVELIGRCPACQGGAGL
ncbi:MAG: transcriptional repressor [Alphaproteobacteria bacterium]|nr:transcriptional repressor [Alphaproteobacteria bacterium]